MSTPMNTMDCSEFAKQLDEWLRGERSAAARVHARECMECRGIAEDFGAIANAARDWSLEDVEPSPRVWNAIRAQLQEEGLIRGESRQAAPVRARPQTQSQVSKPPRWFAGWFSGGLRPALAGGYLAILIALSDAKIDPAAQRRTRFRRACGSIQSGQRQPHRSCFPASESRDC